MDHSWRSLNRANLNFTCASFQLWVHGLKIVVTSITTFPSKQQGRFISRFVPAVQSVLVLVLFLSRPDKCISLSFPFHSTPRVMILNAPTPPEHRQFFLLFSFLFSLSLSVAVSLSLSLSLSLSPSTPPRPSHRDRIFGQWDMQGTMSQRASEACEREKGKVLYSPSLPVMAWTVFSPLSSLCMFSVLHSHFLFLFLSFTLAPHD